MMKGRPRSSFEWPWHGDKKVDDGSLIVLQIGLDRIGLHRKHLDSRSRFCNTRRAV